MLKIRLSWDVKLRRWIGVAHLFQERSDSIYRGLGDSLNI